MNRTLPQQNASVILCWMPFALFSIVLVSLALSGCAGRKSRAFPWASTIQVRPIVPGNVPVAVLAPDVVPDLQVELPAPPTPLEGARREPPRPHVPSPISDSELRRNEGSTLLVPQLTQLELARARQQTSESINIAERNLVAARGRTLNAAQSDVVSKVSGFIEQSRQAASEHDWTRASNLAKKAEVLSRELLHSP